MQSNLRASLGFSLVRAFREVNRASSRALAPYGLSAEQAHVLLALWTEGSMKVGELQRLLSLGSGTLTGALNRMEKASLIRRVPDPSDGRAFRIEPAPFPPARRRAIERTLVEVGERALSALTARERGELLRLLEKVEQGVSDGERE